MAPFKKGTWNCNNQSKINCPNKFGIPIIKSKIIINIFFFSNIVNLLIFNCYVIKDIAINKKSLTKTSIFFLTTNSSAKHNIFEVNVWEHAFKIPTIITEVIFKQFSKVRPQSWSTTLNSLALQRWHLNHTFFFCYSILELAGAKATRLRKTYGIWFIIGWIFYL